MKTNERNRSSYLDIKVNWQDHKISMNSIFRETEGKMVKINERIMNFNWELEFILFLKNQIEVIELKNTIPEIMNSLSDMKDSTNFLTVIQTQKIKDIDLKSHQ